jgi:hypothetical protein
MTVREANQSPVVQGTDETIAYIFDFSNWGTPSSGSSTLLNTRTNTDVSSSCLTGTVSITDNQVTTKSVHALTKNNRYKLLCTVTIGANTESAYCFIDAE